MAVTVRQLIQQLDMELTMRPVAGESGLGHIVRWIHMVEGVEISSFLQGGEIAFTTGIALTSEEELYELVKDTCEHQAAAMVINIGPYIKEIPKRIIEYAKQHDFPLFELPWEVHMANVMQDFSRQLHMDEQRQMELELAFKNGILYPQNEELYMPALMNYGFKSNWSYDIAVLEVKTRQYLPIKNKEREKIQLMAKEYFHAWKSPVVILNWNENIVLAFANATIDEIEPRMEELCQQIRTHVICEGIYYAGIGRTAESIQAVAATYRQAYKVKEIQKRRNHKNKLVHYEKLGLYKLLIEVEREETIRDYVQELLEPIEVYDRLNMTDNLYFLKTFFDLGCSVMNTAERLHMHRNSVTYRIHKIEEITGCDLGDAMTRTQYIVAFMAKELI